MGEVTPIRRAAEVPDEILTRVELADRKKVSLRTVDRWIAEGCPSETWGMRVRRFELSQVNQWLRRREAA